MTYEEWRRRRKALYAMFDEHRDIRDSCPHCREMDEDQPKSLLDHTFEELIKCNDSEWVDRMTAAGETLMAEHD